MTYVVALRLADREGDSLLAGTDEFYHMVAGAFSTSSPLMRSMRSEGSNLPALGPSTETDTKPSKLR